MTNDRKGKLISQKRMLQWGKRNFGDPEFTLDIGCGGNPKGNVNIDLYPNDKMQYCKNWNPKKVQNFVLCDAAHLPFRDDIFTTVNASHVIEHLPNPLKSLIEWKRVATDKVLIRIPSQYSQDDTKTHLYSWNLKTLRNLLVKVFPKVYVRYTERFHEFPIFPKPLPDLVNLLLGRIGFSSELQAVCFVCKHTRCYGEYEAGTRAHLLLTALFYMTHLMAVY